MRAHDIGLFSTSGTRGRLNAITDVEGVAVGHTTLISGHGTRRVGRGPVRTGVTVVLPHTGQVWEQPVAAGIHRLNGNGEMTGAHWINEAGLLGSIIGLTNTHSVGIVHEALIRYEARFRPVDADWWSLPVVAETWDGLLNDINGRHVTAEHVWSAIEQADTGPVHEGSVGSGTGMICFGFKGGIGSSSRAVTGSEQSHTVGVLVQANFGDRPRLRVDGIPVGQHIGADAVPLPTRGQHHQGGGSIITVVATDAPLLPQQCAAMAARASLGIGRAGGVGEIWSGDLSIAFATGNRLLAAPSFRGTGSPPRTVQTIDPNLLSALYAATVDATEEAIINALLAAETMDGCDGVVAHALPVDRVRDLVQQTAEVLR
jgi:D-aminopeptidase